MHGLTFTSRINSRGFLRKGFFFFFDGREGSGPIKDSWKGKASERGPANKRPVFNLKA